MVEQVKKVFKRMVKGMEMNSGEPVAVPVGYKTPPTLEERIASAVRLEVSAIAQSQGFETFDEAEDFEVGDDYDPMDSGTPYELDFDPISQREMTKGERRFLDEKRAEFDKKVEQVKANNIKRAREKQLEEERPNPSRKKSSQPRVSEESED